MDDLLREAMSTLRAMWKHRWLGLAVAWLAGLAGTLAVLWIPDKYEATARIYVDTQSILKPLMSELTVQPNIEQRVLMLSRTLLSRPNVEKLIGMAYPEIGDDSGKMREALADGLMKAIEIKGTTVDNLYSIVFRDEDPEQAKRVVQSLADIFAESGRGSDRKDSESARKFIDEQIAAYEKKLQEAENRLKEFKLRNVEMQLTDGKTATDRIAEIERDLGKARLDLREAENSRDALRHQMSGEDQLAANALGGGPLTETDRRIEAQRQNLDTLLQRYTEQHPDVRGTRRLLAELEEQKRQEALAYKKGGTGSLVLAMKNDPVYQQLKVSLATAEANVASLRARVAEYDSRRSRLMETMKVAPQIEAELTQLNRDYEVNRKNYEALLARRESASLSANLGATGLANFRLVDPPRAGSRPVAPKRLLLLPLVLLFALAAGGFASFAAGRLRPVFFDSLSLREVTGLPMLGSVALRVDDSALQGEKMDQRRFLLGGGGLFAAFGIGFLVLVVIS